MQHILIIHKAIEQSPQVSEVTRLKTRWNEQTDEANQYNNLASIRITYKNAGMKQNQAIHFFKNQLLFSATCQFLSLNEVLNLSAVSPQLKLAVENYCSSKLAELNLKPFTQKSSIHQMQFYFNRCLKMIKQDDKNTPPRSVSIHHPFKFQTIHDFDVGPTFTSYLTSDHKAKIFRTTALLKYYDCSLEQKNDKGKIQTPLYENRDNIKEIKSKSDQCLVLKMSGEVLILTGNKNDEQVVSFCEPIGWTSKIPIATIYNSFTYTIFYPQACGNFQTLVEDIFNKKIQVNGTDEKNKKVCYFIGKNMISSKQFLIEVPCPEVIEATVGCRFAYFISDKNELFQADLQGKIDQQLPIITAKTFQPLKGKTFAKIFAGYNYYVALERKLEKIQEWGTERVVQWLKDIGFESYTNIARVEKLNGLKLKNIQRKYMHNVLGITTQNMQQKFIMSIEQILQKKSSNDQLWGWGKNDKGQLGSSSANYVAKPQKIRLNCIQQEEYVDSIFCGWYQTFIRTQKGRIYCTKVKNTKKRKASENDNEEREQQQFEAIAEKKQEKKMLDSENQYEKEFEQIGRGQKKKNSRQQQQKKRKKNSESHNFGLKQKEKQSNNKRFEEQDSWEEFQFGKAFFIQCHKDTIFIIQCPNQQKEYPNKMKKLRTAKAILDKILWSSLNKQEFKVGYLDKEVGLIEASALDFQKFDVKQNQLKYFKRNGVIVWDRQRKIDMF